MWRNNKTLVLVVTLIPLTNQTNTNLLDLYLMIAGGTFVPNIIDKIAQYLKTVFANLFSIKD